MAANEWYEFGQFRLDFSERRLSRGGEAVPLPPKTLELLLALIRKAGRLVTKQELLDQVWPGAFVEEGILSVHISALRKTLGNGAPTRYIETVSRAGYRFVAPVNQLQSNGLPDPKIGELLERGHAHLGAASMYDVAKALAAFRAAIDLDQTNAAAHAGLALGCCAQACSRIAPSLEAFAQAKQAALRALALDRACADAHAALGSVLFFHEWDWLGAERSLQRAIALDSRHEEACLVYGQLLEALGKLKDGLAMKRQALRADPSPSVLLSISLSYWNQRCYDQAIEWANKALAVHPTHPHAREHLAGAFLMKGDTDAWLAENVKHAETHGVPTAALDPLRQAYAAGGRAGVLKLILQRAAQPESMPALQLAVLYAETADLDRAFHYLDHAIDSRDPALVHLAVAPQWDPLRADPRLLRCLARMGLNPAHKWRLDSAGRSAPILCWLGFSTGYSTASLPILEGQAHNGNT